MNPILQFLREMLTPLRWWVAVMPWEQAVRVRLGRHVAVLGKGFHLRIPVVDVVYKQTVRMRALNLQVQTLTTRDGRTVTLCAALGYAIGDIRKLYETVYHVEDTIAALAASAIAGYVTTHDSNECTPVAIETAVSKRLNFESYGLARAMVTITDFAFVKTYRLISDTRWGSLRGGDLNMQAADGTN